MRRVETNYSEKSTNLGHVNRGKEFFTAVWPDHYLLVRDLVEWQRNGRFRTENAYAHFHVGRRFVLYNYIKYCILALRKCDIWLYSWLSPFWKTADGFMQVDARIGLYSIVIRIDICN